MLLGSGVLAVLGVGLVQAVAVLERYSRLGAVLVVGTVQVAVDLEWPSRLGAVGRGHMLRVG